MMGEDFERLDKKDDLDIIELLLYMIYYEIQKKKIQKIGKK